MTCSTGGVLVTGATGTVGAAATAALARAGVPVRAGARRPRPPAGRRPELEPVALDLRDPPSVARALDGMDRLFLLTPLEEDMVDVAARVVDQAAAAGVRHIVRLSALGAGDGARTRLGAIHRETERAIEACGAAWTALRPNAFMQNYLTAFGGSIRASGHFHAPQGRGRVSLIDVRDVAEVAARVLTEPRPASRILELTGPEALDNHAVAEILGRAVGRPVTYVDVAPEQARDALLRQGASRWLADVLMELYALGARDDAAEVTGDVESVLGRPPTPFARFARDHAGEFR